MDDRASGGTRGSPDQHVPVGLAKDGGRDTRIGRLGSAGRRRDDRERLDLAVR
jgi:hypothetical protein